MAIDYRETTADLGGLKKFAVIYVPPALVTLKPVKYGKYVDKDGKPKIAFTTDEVLFRRGTQSIQASEDEIRFIEHRSSETEHKIGLLNGKPDRVKENLYGNFFEVVKMPEEIFSAELPPNIRFAPFETKDMPFVRQGDSNKIFSFCDLSADPFGKYLIKGSFHRHAFADFLESEDKRILLTWLLNQEVRNVALRVGLKYDWKNKNVYFFPTDSNERNESWPGRLKKSTRLVAKRLYISQLDTWIFVHSAASISFGLVGSDLYLKILPEIVLTYDGYDSIQGVREGIVKTADLQSIQQRLS